MILALLLSTVIGISLGLLGGGGSILTVPILVYAIGVGAKESIAMSLVVVGVTSLSALVGHARAGNVRWKTGATFGLASMLGAYSGGLLADWFSATVLLILFAGMMLVTSIAMMRPRSEAAEDAGHTHSLLAIVAEGFVVGGVTGLVGAGGGFLVVPALVMLGGLPMRAAIGTSLMVIAMKSFAGAAGHLQHVQVDWALTGAVAAAAVVGSVAGSRLASSVPQALLRKVFAWFVLAMGVFIVFRELNLGALIASSPALGLLEVGGGILAVFGLAAYVARKGREVTKVPASVKVPARQIR